MSHIPGRTEPMTREKLIRVFMIDGEPYLLSWAYRTKWGKAAFKEDVAILREMQKEGLVRMVEKTSKRITYQYTPKQTT